MSINENTIIFNKLYRSHYDDKEYFFEEILKKAILRTLTDDTVKAETMAANKVNRLWKYSLCDKTVRCLQSIGRCILHSE